MESHLDFGGTQRLARLVGPGMAKQMIYTARNIKADEAYRIGLVNAVYPQEELIGCCKEVSCRQLLSRLLSLLELARRLSMMVLMQVMDDAIVIEEKLFGSCFETEDQKAGMGNFLEKDKEKKLKGCSISRTANSL